VTNLFRVKIVQFCHKIAVESLWYVQTRFVSFKKVVIGFQIAVCQRRYGQSKPFWITIICNLTIINIRSIKDCHDFLIPHSDDAESFSISTMKVLILAALRDTHSLRNIFRANCPWLVMLVILCTCDNRPPPSSCSTVKGNVSSRPNWACFRLSSVSRLKPLVKTAFCASRNWVWIVLLSTFGSEDVENGNHISAISWSRNESISCNWCHTYSKRFLWTLFWYRVKSNISLFSILDI